MGILDNIKNAILGKQEEEETPVMFLVEDEDTVTEFMEWLTNPARKKKKKEEEDEEEGQD